MRYAHMQQVFFQCTCTCAPHIYMFVNYLFTKNSLTRKTDLFLNMAIYYYKPVAIRTYIPAVAVNTYLNIVMSNPITQK